jgi:Tol biopolymer transport system component
MRCAAPLLCAALFLTGCGSGASSAPERHLVFMRGLATRGQALWIADADGGHERRLVAPADYGVVSPDGRRVAFARNHGQDVYAVDSDGTDDRLVVRGVQLADWAPDGKRLLGLRGAALVVVDAADGRVTTLDRRAVTAESPSGWSFSPDGRSVVYARSAGRPLGPYCSDGTDLYIVALDGGRPRPLVRDGQSSAPVWGRQGIAFRRDRRGCTAGGIWRVGANGSSPSPVLSEPPRRYTSSGYYGLSPYAWLGPDRLVVGLRNEWGDDAALLERGRIRRLGIQLEGASRDGRFLVGTQGGAEWPLTIAIGSIDGGQPRVVARGRVCCADWNR